jgi:threonine dehydrogenase-like Zn-dependent dehydrogenase
MKARAMVQTRDRHLEMVEHEVPRVGPDEGLLKIEACGLCGSDIEQYRGNFVQKGLVRYPLIPGHEPIGRIVEIGADAAKSWGVKVGDRVALEPHLSCGRCGACSRGSYHLCKSLLPVNPAAYGYLPLDFGHGLWGGYSEYIHLHARSRMHKLPEALPLAVASQYQLLAAGIRWSVHVPKTSFGDTVLILGCGQRGLGSVIACAAAGVRQIIVTGLARDAHKLALARDLGAHATIVADRENVVQRVMELTNDRGADVIVDLTPVATQPIVDAIDAVRVGGTIVLAGIKGGSATVPLDSDRVVVKELTVQGVFTQTGPHYDQAISLLARDSAKFTRLATHAFPLGRAADAIETLAGERAGENAICVSLSP